MIQFTKKNTHKVTLGLILIISLLVVFNTGSVLAARGPLTVAMPSDVTAVDPHTEATSWTVSIVNHFFNPLVQREPEDMSTGGRLAESWEMLDDRTYLFNLRPGVTFHNGDEFTAADVVFSFERMRKPGFESMGKYVKPLIESVEAIDDLTVRITLFEPYAPFLQRMASFYIVPKNYIEEVGDEAFAKNPVGTGPYKFVEWVYGEHLKLTANEEYWGGAPEVKDVIFRTIPERFTRLAALMNGEVDLVTDLSSEDVPVLEGNPRTKPLIAADNRFFFFVINSRAGAPFDDVRVRQALTYAINWEEVMTIFDGFASRIAFPALPFDFAYNYYADDLKDYLPEYNPEKAKALLAEAGYPDGFSTKIQAPSVHYPFGADFSQVIGKQLEKVGIDAQVELYEYGYYLTELYRKKKIEGLGLYSMGNPLFDPDHLFNVHFYPGNWYGPAQGDPELIELALKGRTTLDPEERSKIYGEMMKYMLENVPYLFTHAVKQFYGISSELQWSPRMDNRIFINEVSYVE